MKLIDDNPKNHWPFSWKAVLYAVLCALFGTACFYCGLSVLSLLGWGLGSHGEYPYELPAMAVALFVALALFSLCGFLWLCAVAKAPRRWLNILIAISVFLLGFFLFWPVMEYVRVLGEQIGQRIFLGP